MTETVSVAASNRYAGRLGNISALTVLLGIVAIVVGFAADFDGATAFIGGGITLIGIGLVAHIVWCLGSWWEQVSAQHTRAIISWLKDDESA